MTPADRMPSQLMLASDGPWIEVRDGNLTARALFDRHYSRAKNKRADDVRIVGPGGRMVLLTPCARALFVWRDFISKDAQEGINCSVFRNEGAGLASDLIRAAMLLGWQRWPGQRFYTYVAPRRVRSPNPGCCFKRAGWRVCGVTKTRKLLVLEALPPFVCVGCRRRVAEYAGSRASGEGLRCRGCVEAGR